MTTLEDVIVLTQQTIESILTKPKCTKKLLSKPPFRFLHDIVTGVMNVTGFPEHYFTAQELDSANFNDKTSKVAFIEKLIRLVSIGVGEMLPTRATKVVSGAEPLLTNLLITEYAKLAIDDSIDREAIIARSLGQGEIENMLNEDQIPSSIYVDLNDKQYIQSKVHSCTGKVEDTISMISTVISKPKCTEKLLMKPPFRFIHDVIMAVHEKTGVLNECTLSKNDFDSSHFTNKDVKIEFLSKMVKAVKMRLGDINLDLKPSKVVTGLETEQTRRFLQLFILAATSSESSVNEPTSDAAQKKRHDDMPSSEEKSEIIVSTNEAKHLQNSHRNQEQAVNKSTSCAKPEEKDTMEYDFENLQNNGMNHTFNLNTQFTVNSRKFRDMDETKHEPQSLGDLASCVQDLVNSILPIGNFLDSCPRYLNDLNKISDKNEEEYKKTEINYLDIKNKFDQQNRFLLNKIRDIEDETNDINLEIIDLGKNSDLIQKSMQRFLEK